MERHLHKLHNKTQMLKVFLHPACGSVIRNITVGQRSSIVSNGNKMTQLHTYEEVNILCKRINSLILNSVIQIVILLYGYVDFPFI